MSLYGMLGDIDDDPIFGSHMQSMQRMNSLMSSFFTDPFGMMGAHPALMAPDARRNHQNQIDHMNQMNQMSQMSQMNQMNQMIPFGFPPMPSFNNMFTNIADFENMANTGGNFMSSTSIMTYNNGPNGRPLIYQSSKSVRSGPGGIKETKESVYDSRQGLKKMAIGHHIGERAHIIEKKKNLNNGDEEEHQEFINLEDEEAEEFNQEWETHIRGYGNRQNRSNRAIEQSPHHRRTDPKALAITDSSSSSRHNSRNKLQPTSSRRGVRNTASSHSADKFSENSDLKIEEIPKTSSATATTSSSGSRKRGHEDNETHKKRHMSDDSHN